MPRYREGGRPRRKRRIVKRKLSKKGRDKTKKKECYRCGTPTLQRKMNCGICKHCQKTERPI